MPGRYWARAKNTVTYLRALLTAFLTDSYRVGRHVSVLALTSLWILMQVHGLEYAHFYESLYAVVRRATFHARHRARVLRLLMRCLGSPYVPANVVAA